MATLSEVKPVEVKSGSGSKQRRDPALPRDLIMPVGGGHGRQQKLKAAKVLRIGSVADWGSSLALYLTRCGRRNAWHGGLRCRGLQRPVLVDGIHLTADVGRKKFDLAADKLKAINPFVNLRARLTRSRMSANALELVSRIRYCCGWDGLQFSDALFGE